MAEAAIEPLREAITKLDFVDGSASATGAARRAKRNLEAADDEATRSLVGDVMKALEASAAVLEHTFLQGIAKALLSIYRPGMAYGPHVDAPVMSGRRTDFSFTCFLADPSGYSGGELVLVSEGVERRLKPPAGHVAIYPTGWSHWVQPVTSGERVAVVGWITSHVASEPVRKILRSLWRIAQDTEDQADLHLRVLAAYADLYRLHAA